MQEQDRSPQDRFWGFRGHHHHEFNDGDRGRPNGYRRGRRGGRGRASRGDVRAAVLQLLAEEPMHGYQLMQAIGDRSGGRWTPSPGAVYPTINQLEDEGLVTVTADAGRRLVTLTEAGRSQAAEDRNGTSDPFAAYADAGAGANLRTLLEQVHGATREVGRNGSDAQVTQAAEILSKARRALYLLLAEEDADPAGPTRL